MEYVLAALLFVAAAAVVIGCALITPALAWIVAGLLGAVWALVVFRGTAPVPVEDTEP